MAIKIPDVILQLLVPIVIEQGFSAIPEKQKPLFCVVFAAGFSEIVAQAAASGTTIDDKIVAATGDEVKAYMESKGFPALFEDVNDFVVIA